MKRVQKRTRRRVPNCHPVFGCMSRHHLVPKQRIKDYYGDVLFQMPHNILHLWRLRHNAWHALFRQETMNETIQYLEKTKVADIRGYHTKDWYILFGQKTKRDVIRLLKRTRRMIRKKYQYLELDPSLRVKIIKMKKKSRSSAFVRNYIDKQFFHRTRAVRA